MQNYQLLKNNRIQLPLWTGQAGDEGALIPAVDQGGDAPAGLPQDQGEAREEHETFPHGLKQVT